MRIFAKISLTVLTKTLKMRKTLFLLLLAIVMPTVATADTGRAVYNLGEGTHDWGTGDSRNETYNVALRIADEAYVGCRVTGVRIWFTTVEGLSATRAWLSKASSTMRRALTVCRRLTSSSSISKAATRSSSVPAAQSPRSRHTCSPRARRARVPRSCLARLNLQRLRFCHSEAARPNWK